MHRFVSSSASFGVALLLTGASACTPASPPAAKSEPTPKSEPAPAPAAEVTPAPEPEPESAPAPAPAPVLSAFAASQPCLITTKSHDPDAGFDCTEVWALQVAGHAQRVCTPSDTPDRYSYDARGRILDGSFHTYEYTDDTHAKVTRTGGDDDDERVSEATFDDQGRMISDRHGRYTFDASGRLIRSEGKYFTTYTYAEDGTYVTNNNYPDSDEQCEADLVEVTRDEHGRNAVEVYEGCEIADTPRTMRYTYDAAGRAVSIEVDRHSDGTVDYTITADYACHGL